MAPLQQIKLHNNDPLLESNQVTHNFMSYVINNVLYKGCLSIISLIF